MMHRLQFDVTDETLKEIDELQRVTEFPSRAVLIRNALRFLQWLIQEMRGGGRLLIEKDGKQEAIVFPFLLPSAAKRETAPAGTIAAAD